MSEKSTSLSHYCALILRALGVLLLLLLHLVMLQWADSHLDLSSLKQTDPQPVTVALLPPLAPLQPAASPQPRPKPAAPKLKPMPPVKTIIAASPAMEPAFPPLPAGVPGEMEVVAEEAPAGAPTQPDTTPAAGEEPAAAFPHYQVRTPPSAELRYDVRAVYEGKEVFGHGKIAWNTDGERYRIAGETGMLFFTVLSFQSQGAVDEFGLAPERYSEKRFRKAETSTVLDPRPGHIRFSASEKSYPRNGGEQDRASMVWQLASIGLGEAAQYAPGAQLRLFVAGVRNAEPWVVQVIGLEQIDTPAGSLQAWHVARLPRPGSRDQKLDIWLAPQHSWYPVRLRYTETNGEYLDMALSSLQLPTPT